MSKNSAAATNKKVKIGNVTKKPAGKILHVVPHAEGWVIRREGSLRVSSLHGTQREAIETGRALAERNAITLVIHGRDGRVKSWDSYNRDPTPAREPRKVLYPTSMPRTASKRAIKRAVSEAISERASAMATKDTKQ
jgi:hypothetical protein